MSAEERPDITGVASFIADELILHTERLRHTNHVLERKLEKEKRQKQKFHRQANNYMQNCHKLFIASQEQPDRLAGFCHSLAGSVNGGMVNGATNGHLDQNNNCILDADRDVDYGDEEEEPSSSDSNNSAESLRMAFSRPPKPPSATTRRKLDFNNNLEVVIPPSGNLSLTFPTVVSPDTYV